MEEQPDDLQEYMRDRKMISTLFMLGDIKQKSEAERKVLKDLDAPLHEHIHAHNEAIELIAFFEKAYDFVGVRNPSALLTDMMQELPKIQSRLAKSYQQSRELLGKTTEVKLAPFDTGQVKKEIKVAKLLNLKHEEALTVITTFNIKLRDFSTALQIVQEHNMAHKRALIHFNLLTKQQRSSYQDATLSCKELQQLLSSMRSELEKVSHAKQKLFIPYLANIIRHVKQECSSSDTHQQKIALTARKERLHGILQHPFLLFQTHYAIENALAQCDKQLLELSTSATSCVSPDQAISAKEHQ